MLQWVVVDMSPDLDFPFAVQDFVVDSCHGCLFRIVRLAPSILDQIRCKIT